MKKLLVIVGPTATGKTGLGVELARKFNGEIVSADSRQVYRRLDIGTGKDISKSSKFKVQSSKFELKSQKYTVGYYKIDDIRVWLYDVIDPKIKFSAVEYAELAWRVIRDIWKRGRLPILTGGTGFYIKVALEGIDTSGIPADWKLRGELEKLSNTELQKILRTLNPQKWKQMNKSDRNNPRRLVRAIEIIYSEDRRQKSSLSKRSDVLKIGLTASTEILYEKIDRRVEKRVHDGIVDEIEELLDKGCTWDDPGFNTLGYKEWKAYFSGKATKEKIIQTWKYDEHGYARRQLTWFRKDKKIRWYDITESGLMKRVTEDVEKWYYN